jgi:hypothetical protein
MPANRVVETAYIGPFASIESVNASSAYYPGQVGQRIITATNKQYQFVQLDSGALTAATVGQVLYWKDRANYVVTNNNLFANGGSPTTTSTARNMIAGVATAASVTAGYYTFIQQQGLHSAVVATSGSPAAGDFAVGDTTTGKATSVAVATAPTVDVIGRVRTTQSSSTAWPVDLSIVGIP